MPRIPNNMIQELSESSPEDVGDKWPDITLSTKKELSNLVPEFDRTSASIGSKTTSAADVWNNLSKRAQKNIISSGRQLIAQGIEL